MLNLFFRAPQPTEFDFDDTSLELSTKLTPRKTPGFYIF